MQGKTLTSSELSSVIELKQNIRDSYNRIDEKYRLFHDKYDATYNPYPIEISYEISSVDFYFGDIACEFDGSNELSTKLFNVNNSFSDVSIYEISTNTLKKLCNWCYKAYNDLCEDQIELIDDSKNQKNDIINEFKSFIKKIIDEVDITTIIKEYFSKK